MLSLSFFFGSKKLRIWYIIFYLLSLPLYLFGLYLLIQIQHTTSPETREFVLTIFSFGYLLLALGSLINTICYIKLSKRVFWSLFVFLGIQIVFWMIGNFLGNNYSLLFFLFLAFLCVAIYGNLVILKKISHHHNLHNK